MIVDQAQIWFVIIGLAFGTFLIRYSFLGLLGNRELPEWFLRHLRYVGVAIMPGLIAPLILWPEATGGTPDLSRLLATLAAITVGVWKRNVVATVVTGFATLYIVQYFTG